VERVETALYFPRIQVPRAPWFTHVLLYWDQVSSIIPYDLESVELDDYMQELLKSNLVTRVAPYEVQYLNDVQGYDEQFIRLLESSPLPKSHPPYRWSKIHQEKASPELFENMRDLGLAKDPNRWWWWVEERTAALYMLYLVGSICRCIPGVFPVTDTRLTLDALAEPLDDDKSSRLQSLKLAAILGALPVPSEPVPPSELASFKREHEAQLRNLHSYLNEKLEELANIDNEQVRSDATVQVLAEIHDDVQVLQEQMSKQQWPKIIRAGVAGVIIGGLAVGAAVASGGTALALALGVTAAGAAQAPAASGIAKSIRFKKNAPGKRLAYAALAGMLDAPANALSELSTQPADRHRGLLRGLRLRFSRRH
jgi:Family of unknown function (DUF6236)